LRIGIITPELLPNWGGVGTYCIELAKAMCDKHEIHLVTLEREKRGKSIYSKKEMINFFDGKINVHILTKASMKDTFFYNGKFQMAIYKKLPQILNEYNFDLIHSHFPSVPDILFQFRNLNTPTLTTIHTFIDSHREGTKESKQSFSEQERSEKFTFLFYPLLKLSEVIYFSKKRYYLTPSNWMKKKVESRFPNLDIEVIPNSVNFTYFKKNKNPVLPDDLKKKIENRKVILYSGRLLTLKGINTLIKAIPKVLNVYGKPDLIFVFAGPGDPSPYIKILKKMNVEERR